MIGVTRWKLRYPQKLELTIRALKNYVSGTRPHKGRYHIFEKITRIMIVPFLPISIDLVHKHAKTTVGKLDWWCVTSIFHLKWYVVIISSALILCTQFKVMCRLVHCSTWLFPQWYQMLPWHFRYWFNVWISCLSVIYSFHFTLYHWDISWPRNTVFWTRNCEWQATAFSKWEHNFWNHPYLVWNYTKWFWSSMHKVTNFWEWITRHPFTKYKRPAQ